MNSSNLLTWLVDIALLTGPIFLGIAATIGRDWLVKHGYKTDLYDILTQGAGAAYAYLARNNKKISDPAALVAAIEYGFGVVMQSPDIDAKLTKLNLTPEYVKKLMVAEVGKLAATDPSVLVGEAVANSPVAVAVSADAATIEGEAGKAADLANGIKNAVVDTIEEAKAHG